MLRWHWSVCILGLLMITTWGLASPPGGQNLPGLFYAPLQVSPPSYYHYPMFVPPTSLRYPGIPYVPPPSYYLSNPVNRPGFINPPVSPPGPAVSSPSTINPENTLLRPLSSFREGTLLTEAPAFLEIRVPPDAELRIGNFQARQTGEVRYFVSPPLPRGREYTYEIRARWQKNGKDLVRTRQVDVWAGARKIVDFTEGNEES